MDETSWQLDMRLLEIMARTTGFLVWRLLLIEGVVVLDKKEGVVAAVLVARGWGDMTK
eukprot:CAMPEP_0113615584 /NCGR_PEP_ID=MMETSP0017_2-20120614/7781_1 /TAXON_ID=2856 /ORGANISM="Cylindrotheca closterium" /LENGTH=57 /DNA_ID=CAMNT_0000524835 /DNA_START=1167 /DNA_END=1340 /DNA_ORIENTATION=- /assembly_acc=CAM_ASM_000147